MMTRNKNLIFYSIVDTTTITNSKIKTLQFSNVVRFLINESVLVHLLEKKSQEFTCKEHDKAHRPMELIESCIMFTMQEIDTIIIENPTISIKNICYKREIDIYDKQKIRTNACCSVLA